jgi:hypothetical protein
MLNHRTCVVWLATIATAAAICTSVDAHERKTAGQYHIVIGWADEPAFSGVKNAIEVDLTDAAGKPVAALGGGALSVEVIYGEQRVTLPLRPVLASPGKFQAWLTPTRSGTYTFHLSGTVHGTAIDVSSTCSDTTFACVDNATDLQFPAKDPSASELADRVSRGLPRAEDAASTAGSARTIALASVALAVTALAVAVRRK